MPYRKEILSLALFLSTNSLSNNSPSSADPLVAVAPSTLSSPLQNEHQTSVQIDNETLAKWKQSAATTIENRVFSSGVAAKATNQPLICKLYFDEEGEVSCVQVKNSIGDRPFEDHVVSRLVGTRLEKPPANATSISASFRAPRSVEILFCDK